MNQPKPEDYEGVGRTLPGARQPLPEPSPPLAPVPKAPPRGEGDGELPAVAPGARYGLPRLTREEIFIDYE